MSWRYIFLAVLGVVGVCALPACTRASYSCDLPAQCSSGSGTFKFCSTKDLKSCQYQASDGSNFDCQSCADCTGAETAVAGWCQGVAVAVDMAQNVLHIPDMATTVGTCSDGIKNQNETDIDCGGGVCPACADGKHCLFLTDCLDNSCMGGVCMTTAAKLAVGSACTTPSSCAGNNAACFTTLGTIAASGGYCTDQPCANNNDCSTGSFCPGGGANYCMGLCTDKNQCQLVNPNNRCFFYDNTYEACLPSALSECDPTLGTSCSNTGACQRSGPDNVGTCLTTCSFGGVCPNDSTGAAQNCYFLNNKLDTAGNPVGDVFQGLACEPQNTAGADGATCSFLNDCIASEECDIYSVGGSKVCRKLCRSGMAPSDCVSGTCQNAFRLSSFVLGSIGLCF